MSVAVWAAPAVFTSDRLAAATGSCISSTSTCEFSTGLEGWTIDNTFGPGVNGLWNHSTDRDSGALHYGRGIGGNYRTGNNRNSGAVTSGSFDLPSTGPLTVTFTVFRDVETWTNNNYDVLRFSILGSVSNQTLWSAGSDGGTGGVFQTINVAIPAAFLGDTVQFRFDFDTVDGLFNNFEGIYIGRIVVPACPTPPAAAAAFSASSLSSSMSRVDSPADNPSPKR